MKKLLISLAFATPIFAHAAKDVAIKIEVENGDNRGFVGSKIITVKEIDGQKIDRVQLVPANEDVDHYLSELAESPSYICSARLGMVRAQGTLKGNVMVKISTVFAISDCK